MEGYKKSVAEYEDIHCKAFLATDDELTWSKFILKFFCLNFFIYFYPLFYCKHI
jgi:hypothetical protein